MHEVNGMVGCNLFTRGKRKAYAAFMHGGCRSGTWYLPCFIPSLCFPRYEYHLISMQEDAGWRGLHKTPELAFLYYLDTHRWLKLF
jgi:hypothetical protein